MSNILIHIPVLITLLHIQETFYIILMEIGILDLNKFISDEF